MPRTLTEDQSVKLARLLIMMDVPKEMALEILTAIETPQELSLFLDNLAVKNFEMTPEEVYQALIEAIEEMQHIEFLEMENDPKRNRVFFYKTEKISIEDVKPGDVVRINIWNPKRYGVRELGYFGRIEKVTKCYFWILEFCGPYLDSANECSVSFLSKLFDNPEKFTKKWAKTSLVDIWRAKLN